MEPQQEKERMMLQYLTYALFAVMVIVVGIVAYNDNRNINSNPYPEQVNVPEINLLTEEGFQIERNNLINYQKAREVSTVQTNDNKPVPDKHQSVNVEEKTVAKEMVSEDSTPPTSNEIKRVKSIEPDGTVIFETVTNYQAIPLESEIIALSPTGKKDFMFLSGTIHKIDLTNQYISFMQDNGQGLATFKYNSKTTFLINGKHFSVSNLTAGDKVSIEGYGYEGTTHILETTTVTLKEVFVGF